MSSLLQRAWGSRQSHLSRYFSALRLLLKKQTGGGRRGGPEAGGQEATRLPLGCSKDECSKGEFSEDAGGKQVGGKDAGDKDGAEAARVRELEGLVAELQRAATGTDAALLLYMCPHTTVCVSSYYYVRVLVLLCMCPRTAMYVPSYCYMSVLIGVLCMCGQAMALG
jgi:hypothetical protein